MIENNGSEDQMPAEFFLSEFLKKNKDITVLYKYKSFIESRLESDFVQGAHWCSVAEDLNDPFDIQLLYPKKISNKELRKILDIYSEIDFSRVVNAKPDNIAEFVGNLDKLAPLEELFLIALQFGQKDLLKHLLSRRKSGEWVKKLFELSLELLAENLQTVAVFCLGEKNNERLLWSHYASSYKGYCIGYLAPTGIKNPGIVHKVSYKPKNYKISPTDIILNPGQSVLKVITTKSLDWKYESEWRFVSGPEGGLCPRFFPIREVIFGYKMTNDQINKIKTMLNGKNVSFYQATPVKGSESFEVRVEPI